MSRPGPTSLESVTVEDVRAAARDVFRNENSVTGWLMPAGTTSGSCRSDPRRLPRARPGLLAAGASAARAEIDIVSVTSPGGIEAWLYEDHTLPILTIDASFLGGAGLDPEGREGTAALMAALLDEGAGALDSAAFATALEDLVADIGFATSDDDVRLSGDDADRHPRRDDRPPASRPHRAALRRRAGRAAARPDPRVDPAERRRPADPRRGRASMRRPSPGTPTAVRPAEARSRWPPSPSPTSAPSTRRR